MRKLCEPFPLSWCRNVDFLPILSMQTKLNKRQVIYHFEGSVSISHSKKMSEPMTDELGITFTPNITDATKQDISFGDAVPDIENILSLGEIWDAAKNRYSDIPDVVIHNKGILHDIPKNIINEKAVDGAEYLFQSQSSSGNNYSMLREKLNLPVVNTFQIAKAGLLEHEDIHPNDQCFRRIKSILKTDFIKPSNNIGWTELHPILFKTVRGLRGKIEGRKAGLNWWEDTAQPIYFSGNVDHTALNVRICMLDDRHKLIGI